MNACIIYWSYVKFINNYFIIGYYFGLFYPIMCTINLIKLNILEKIKSEKKRLSLAALDLATSYYIYLYTYISYVNLEIQTNNVDKLEIGSGSARNRFNNRIIVYIIY